MGIDPRGFVVAMGHNFVASSGIGHGGFSCEPWLRRFDLAGNRVDFGVKLPQFLTWNMDCGAAAAFESDGRLHVFGPLGVAQYPPDEVDPDRYPNTTVHGWAYALHDDGRVVLAGRPLSSPRIDPFTLVEIGVEGEVARQVGLRGMDNVASLLLDDDGSVVVVGEGETVARSFAPDWTERWAWTENAPVGGLTAAVRDPTDGMWFAADATLLQVDDDGAMGNLVAPLEDETMHGIVALAVLADGGVCSGGDLTNGTEESPPVWQTMCRNPDGTLRWRALGSENTSERNLYVLSNNPRAIHRFAWTRLHAMPDGDLIALVPGDGIVRFDPLGNVEWTVPLTSSNQR